MNWRDSPELLQKLAAAYALGTLAGPARRRFETVLRSHPEAARAVAAWNRRWLPLAGQLAPQQASGQLWQRIEQRAFGGGSVGGTNSAAHHANTPRPSPRPAWRRFFDVVLAPLPAGALACGLAFGMSLGVALPGALAPDRVTELPESYVGVLATAQGRTGLIVSSRRHGKVMDIKRVAEIEVPAGRGLFLWAIDAQGVAAAIGPVPHGSFVRVPLAQPAEQLFAKAVELGLSFELPGTPPAAPTTAYAYRGLCGKLWRAAVPK